MSLVLQKRRIFRHVGVHHKVGIFTVLWNNKRTFADARNISIKGKKQGKRGLKLLTSLVIITRNTFFLTSVFIRCLRASSNNLVFSIWAEDAAINSLPFLLDKDEPAIHQRPT